MLLLTISPMIISSTSIYPSSITMVTTPGLTQYWWSVVLGLIALLSVREVFSVSGIWNQYLDSSFNMAIGPLLINLLLIIFFKVEHIIGWLQPYRTFCLFSIFFRKIAFFVSFFDEFLLKNYMAFNIKSF